MGLVCWKCGASLKKLGVIGRLDLCPECRVDLHVCRLCRHYDPNVSGDCRKEEADYVTSKAQANYCQYFKPRPNAYNSDAKRDSSREALAALFGGEEGGENGGQELSPKVNKRKARAELDALFGGVGVEQDEIAEEDKARQALEDLFKK